MESREWGILVSKAYSDGTTQQLIFNFEDWGPDDVTTSASHQPFHHPELGDPM
jgi:hypothetical protein